MIENAITVHSFTVALQLCLFFWEYFFSEVKFIHLYFFLCHSQLIGKIIKHLHAIHLSKSHSSYKKKRNRNGNKSNNINNYDFFFLYKLIFFSMNFCQRLFSIYIPIIQKKKINITQLFLLSWYFFMPNYISL